MTEKCFRATERGYRSSFSTRRGGVVGHVVYRGHRYGATTNTGIVKEVTEAGKRKTEVSD